MARPFSRRTLIFLFSTIVLCALSVWTLDGAVAHFCSKSWLYYHQHQFAVGAGVLLAPLLVIAAICIGWISLQGRLSRFSEAAILATVSATVGFAINNLVLKPVFGRRDVDVFLYHPKNAGFYALQGTWKASFPSGHMVIVSGLLTIAWLWYPRFRAGYCAIVISACLILVIGEWHFVSDTLAGIVWGSFLALSITNLWQRYIETYRAQRDV